MVLCLEPRFTRNASRSNCTAAVNSCQRNPGRAETPARAERSKTPNLVLARHCGHARDQPQKTRDAMIDIDNTMTRDETAKPSRRHRPRGGRKNRKGSRDEAEPSKKLFNPDSGELFDPEEEARKAEAEAARKREEKERLAQVEKEAAAGRNAKADEWRPSDLKRAPGGLREEDFPALPGGPAPKPAIAVRPPPAPQREQPSGPRFRGKVVGNWTNSGPKGQAWIRPDGVAENERKDLLLYRDHVAKGLQLKAGDRVEYGVHNRPTSQGRSVAVKVTKLDASMLRRAPTNRAGVKVEDAGVPLAQRVVRDDGLQRALAASRADFDAEEQKRLAEREDEELAKALMLSAAAASEDDRRRREQEAAEASRRMAEMAAAKREAEAAETAAKREADAEADRRVAEVVVAGTETQPETQVPPDNLAEAERRAAAARAQLAQIEQARRAAAEELRASQNIVEDARRRAARDQQRTLAFQPQSPPRSLAALEQEWRQKTPGTPGTVRKTITLATRPAFDSKQRDFVAFLASIGLQHYAQKLREEQIDCIADLKILNNEDLEACGIPPRDAATMMAGLADLHPGVA